MIEAIERLTAAGCARSFFAGEHTAVEVTAAMLGRIDRIDPAVGAYLRVDREGALARAADLDRRRASLDPARHPLAGVPLALKDNLCTEGVPTTCASRILDGWVPPYDATVVRRLRDAGAVFLGKTNMDEFAMGSSTENSAFHPTRNPWDPGRIPGGSSGGSAAATAAMLCLGALGSDTGGSIRQPASLCGVVGLKPTYGLVSRYGLVAFASSLDQIGPFARTVEDAALLLSVIAGHDPADSTSVERPVPDYRAGLDQPLAGLKAGLPVEYFRGGLDPEVEASVRQAVALLSAAGVEIREVSLPNTDAAVATYYIIAPAEASSNLARYDGVRFGLRDADAADLAGMYRATRRAGFGPEVKRRIMLGTYTLSAGYYDAYYRQAQKARTLIRRDFEAVFGKVDLLLTPTAPTPAFRIGEKTGDPLQMYLSDIFTIPVNLAGIPAVSVPCGFTGGGLPIGLQILGRPFEEELLLRAARRFERDRALGTALPSVAGGAS
jgi:aspartyl-tRNA(Asn)/glutamyl-tRNA(Gln) amidotransferase subunit A